MPENPRRPVDRERSRACMAEAETALGRKDRDAARRALELAMAHDSSDDELPMLLAVLELEDGRCAHAARGALRALELRWFHPAALNLLAVAAMDVQRFDLAVELAERALRAAPGFVRARKNLKQARRQRKQLRRGGAAQRPGAEFPVDEIRALLDRAGPVLSAVVVATESGDALAQLDSLRGVAGRILVLDACGERGTVSPPPDSGVEVRRWSWDDDPGSAWNEGLRSVCGDWVLLLGPGERLREASARTWATTLARSRALVQTVEIRPAGSGVGVRKPRLLRNAPGLAFSGRWCPDLGESLAALLPRWGLEAGDAPLTLNLEPTLEPPGIPEERLHIERDLRDDGGNRRARLRLGVLSLREGRYADALEEIRRARRALDSPEREWSALDFEEPCTLEAYALACLGRNDELLARLAEYRRHLRPTRNMLYLEGLALLGRRQPGRAADVLAEALSLEPAPTHAAPLVEAHGPDLPNLLGAARLDLHDLPGARAAFETAQTIDPANLEARLGLLGLRLSDGELEEVLHELDRLVQQHGDEPRVWLAGGIVLGRVPSLATAALQWMEEGHRRCPDDRQIRQRLGEAHLRCGDGRRALEVWEPGAAVAGAADVAAALACGEPLPALPADRKGDALAGELLGWFRTWMTCGALSALDRALTDIARAERAVPGFAERTAVWLTEIGQTEAASRARARAGSPGEAPR